MNARIQLLRPGNCVMVAVAVVIGALIGKGTQGLVDYQVEVGLACMVAFLFTGAGNTLNDYFDRKNDQINHPGRPIPSGRISPKGALAYSIFLFTLALALAIFINFIVLAIVIANLVVMVSYETIFKAKGASGNMTISWLTATTFLFGGAVVWAAESTVILAVLAFFATLGREIVKDMEDIKGDLDRSTLPMKIGIKKAGVVATFAILIGVVISPIPAISGIFSAGSRILYIPFIIVADAIFIYCIPLLMSGKMGTSTPLKGAMIVALLAFLAGGIVRW